MYEELIANHALFKATLSDELELAYSRIFMGLGLPVPNRHFPRTPFGYNREGKVLLPEENDLQIFRMAFDMIESKQYHQEDVIIWLGQAPLKKPISRRTFFNLRDVRPPFPEIKLPVEERIALVYRITSPATQEAFARSEATTGEPEARYSERTQGAGEGDGETEGSSRREAF